MTLTINGETKQFNQGITLQEIIKSLQIEEKVMAAAVNMEIVKKMIGIDILQMTKIN